MFRSRKIGFILALAMTMVFVASDVSADSRKLSRRDRREVAEQLKEIKAQIAQAETAALNGVLDEVRVCILRAKDSCADGNNCDTGRECRKNTAMIAVTDCACYDKKKETKAVGGGAVVID
jgi:hypothetical protein